MFNKYTSLLSSKRYQILPKNAISHGYASLILERVVKTREEEEEEEEENTITFRLKCIVIA